MSIDFDLHQLYWSKNFKPVNFQDSMNYFAIKSIELIMMILDQITINFYFIINLTYSDIINY